MRLKNSAWSSATAGTRRVRTLEQSLFRAEIVGNAVNLARDLVNTPPAEKSPEQLANRIGVVAADAGLDIDIWDESRIRHERFGGLIGVAAGSDEPPRFVVLEYRHGGQFAHGVPGRQGRDVRLGRPELETERVDGRHEKRHDGGRRRRRHDASRRAAGDCRSMSLDTSPSPRT